MIIPYTYGVNFKYNKLLSVGKLDNLNDTTYFVNASRSFLDLKFNRCIFHFRNSTDLDIIKHLAKYFGADTISMNDKIFKRVGIFFFKLFSSKNTKVVLTNV